MRFIFHRILPVLCLLVWTGCPVGAEPPVFKYKAVIQGVDESDVKKAIKAASLVFILKDRPSATVGQLQRRVDQDLLMIGKILESRGYYDAKVTATIDADVQPCLVTLLVDSGTQYTFGAVEFLFLGPEDPRTKDIQARLRSGSRVTADNVFVEEQRVLSLMKENGYPFCMLEKRVVSVNREKKVVDVKMTFNPGILSYYGPVEVTGLTTLNLNYIERQLPWKPGDQYNAKLVSEFENTLLSSGSFGIARIEVEEPQQGSNSIPVKIELKERDLRTIRLGLGYSDIGVEGKAIWEHRNVFGSGENLKVGVNASPIETDANVSLERKGFLRANQSLTLSVDLAREKPDAYDADVVLVGGIVRRDFTYEIMGGTGLRYKYSEVEQMDGKDYYSYLIFPVFFLFDYRNDELNPVRGYQVFAQSRYFAALRDSESFQKSELEGRIYKMFWERPRLSGALRVSVGSIAGASVEEVPADERFYAGGGGSIRGYEYQKVGPRERNTPAGGLQLFEFSAELRLRPGQKMGYAAFVDGGTVYTDFMDDDSNRSLRYGAGVGIRFFTSFGPLRMDVAYPLNPDEKQKSDLQFYISLGQAF